MNFRGTRARLVASLKLIPAVLAGRHPDALGLREVFFNSLGAAVLRLAQDDFRTKLGGGTGRDGIRWQPLAEATLERRRRAGRTDDSILVETLRLLASLEFDSADSYVTPTEGGAVVGSSVPYGSFHQHGIPGRLPARPVFPADIPAGWLEAFEAACVEALAPVVARVAERGGID